MRKAIVLFSLLIALMLGLTPTVVFADAAPGFYKAIAVAGGTVTVKAAPGVFYGFVITTAGTAAFTCYDNASAASGTVVYVSAATTAVGANPIAGGVPFTRGLTCSFPASSPAALILYT